MNAPFPQRTRPITIAILAMGGEGGGVLADWIIDLAENNRLPRATHLGAGRRAAHRRDDLLSRDLSARRRSPSGREPVLALMPVPGDVDIVVASELMEAGRAIQRGLVTPDRTTLIASTNRVFSMTEKIAMADGRVERGEAGRGLPRGGARRCTPSTWRRSPKRPAASSARCCSARSPAQACCRSRARRSRPRSNAAASASQASLAAFTAGFEATTAAAPRRSKTPAPRCRHRRSTDRMRTRRRRRRAAQRPIPAELLLRRETFPAGARAIVRAGIERTADYQGLAYARLYLDRLAPIAAARPATAA